MSGLPSSASKVSGAGRPSRGALLPLLACAAILCSLLAPIPARAEDPAVPPASTTKTTTGGSVVKNVDSPDQARRAALVRVEEQVALTGKARVVLSLQTPFQAEGGLSESRAAEQRAQIRAATDLLVRRIEAAGGRVLRQYEGMPFLAAELNDGALAAVESSSQVGMVRLDEVRRESLYRSIPKIGADRALQYGFSGAGWSVAVIDNGVQTSHPFFTGRARHDACFESAAFTCPGSSGSYVGPGAAAGLPGASHGTHVAGIALGSGGPAGLRGVAPSAGLIPVRVFGPDGAYDSDILAGLNYVYSLRATARIAAVNLSIGGDLYDRQSTCDWYYPDYQSMFAQLNSAGIAAVAASGNDGALAISAPACVSGAISVGATDDTDGVPSWSNSARFLTFFAPGTETVGKGQSPAAVRDGVGIYSSVPGSYARKSGTSMSAPHIAGAFAVLRQAYPDESVSSLVSRIARNSPTVCDALAPEVCKPRIDVWRSLELAAPGAPSQVSVIPGDQAGFVSWQQPATAAGLVESYTAVARRTSDNVLAGTCATGASGRACAISGLANGKSYRVTVSASNSIGSGPGQVSGTFVPSAGLASPQYVPVPPTRAADTRSGVGVRPGVVPGGSVLEVPVAGALEVPRSAAAVSLNVTAVGPSEYGFVTAYPCGEARPTSSTLNFVAGQTIANAAIARPGSDGRVCLFTSASTHLLVDVNGFFPASAKYVPINPVRAADTRYGTGVGIPPGPVAAGSVLEVPIAGWYAPSDSVALSLNVTAVYPTGYGFVTVFPCGEDRPTASTLNYVSGRTIANAALARPGAGGKVCLFTSQTTQLIVDVSGSLPAASGYQSFTPVRVADTRNGTGGVPTGPLPPDGILEVQVAGVPGVPSDATAVSLNVTAAYSGGYGFVTLFPCGDQRPTASTLNYAAGQTIANAALARPGTGGKVCLFTSQNTQLIVDVNGFFPGDLAPPGPVTNLRTTDVDAREISLAWNNPADADLAQIIVRRAVGGVPPAGPTDGSGVALGDPRASRVTDVGLTPSTQYAYAVFTRDTSGNVRVPGASVVATTADGTPPGPVTDLAVTMTTPSRISLSWTNPSDPDLALVIVRRAAGNIPPGSPTAGTEVPLSDPLAATATDSGLAPNTRYSYSVFTRDRSGNTRSPGVTIAGTTDSFLQITAGESHTCALDADGKAWCWGSNWGGQLGTGSTSHLAVRSPVAVLGGHTFTSIAAGFSHTCAVAKGGALWCWGDNWSGQLGDGSTTSRSEPVMVSGGRAFTSIAAGGYHSCALAIGGLAYCWGYNSSGQLGDGSTTSRSEPVMVSGGRTYTRVAAGYQHSCAVASGGAAYCWGSSGHGQLGDGSTTSSSVPVAVSGGRTYSGITAGEYHSCAVATGGAAYCWGRNNYGQLGDGSTTSRSAPVLVSGGRTYSSITVGKEYACALASTGSAWCWGDNQRGQLGDGSTVQNRLTPVQVAGGRSYAQAAAGSFHSCAVTSSGAAWCWGDNDHGQVGAGIEWTPIWTPAAV